MKVEEAPKKGLALDVPATAAVISATAFVSDKIVHHPDAGWIAISTVPAIAAGLFRKRWFAYSLLMGSAGSAFTNDGFPVLISWALAGVFLSASLSRRIGDPKNINDHH